MIKFHKKISLHIRNGYSKFRIFLLLGIMSTEFVANGQFIVDIPEFHLSAYTIYDHEDPVVAMDSSGNFVVVWQVSSPNEKHIHAQIYNSSGAAQGSEFIVNPHGMETERAPFVAIKSNGDFVITFQRSNTIYAQRYKISGVLIGSEIIVGIPDSAHYHGRSSTVIDENGTISILWEDTYLNSKLKWSYDTYIRSFDSSGTALGPRVKLNSGSIMAMSGDGDLLIFINFMDESK
jgi:hypothetical protein